MQNLHFYDEKSAPYEKMFKFCLDFHRILLIFAYQNNLNLTIKYTNYE